MPYTTETAVRYIIEVSATAPVALCISDAAGILDDVIGADVLAARANMAERVNRWLAAHLLASGPEPRTASESVKGVSELYQYKLGKGLATTMYGTQAMLADTTGKLAAWSKSIEDGTQRRVSVSWLGTPAPSPGV